MKILKKCRLLLGDSSPTFLGEVGMLEPSCGPTWTSGKELLALAIFRVSKNSNSLKYSIHHQPGNRTQLRDDLELRYASLARGKVYGDQLRRYLSQKNDLAELGQLLVGFRPDFIFMQEVTRSKEQLEAILGRSYDCQVNLNPDDVNQPGTAVAWRNTMEVEVRG